MRNPFFEQPIPPMTSRADVAERVLGKPARRVVERLQSEADDHVHTVEESSLDSVEEMPPTPEEMRYRELKKKAEGYIKEARDFCEPNEASGTVMYLQKLVPILHKEKLPIDDLLEKMIAATEDPTLGSMRLTTRLEVAKTLVEVGLKEEAKELVDLDPAMRSGLTTLHQVVEIFLLLDDVPRAEKYLKTTVKPMDVLIGDGMVAVHLLQKGAAEGESRLVHVFQGYRATDHSAEEYVQFMYLLCQAARVGFKIKPWLNECIKRMNQRVYPGRMEFTSELLQRLVIVHLQILHFSQAKKILGYLREQRNDSTFFYYAIVEAYYRAGLSKEAELFLEEIPVEKKSVSKEAEIRLDLGDWQAAETYLNQAYGQHPSGKGEGVSRDEKERLLLQARIGVEILRHLREDPL